MLYVKVEQGSWFLSSLGLLDPEPLLLASEWKLQNTRECLLGRNYDQLGVGDSLGEILSSAPKPQLCGNSWESHWLREGQGMI